MIERRVDWKRRARCNRIFLALTRWNRALSIILKIVKHIGLILAILILIAYYARHPNEKPDWLPEFLTRHP